MGDLALVGANGAGEAMVAVAETPRQRFGLPLAVLSGLCLAAAFPSLEIAPLAWIGLVPLLFAIRGRTPGAARNGTLDFQQGTLANYGAGTGAGTVKAPGADRIPSRSPS